MRDPQSVPDVSVIIPAWNASATVADAVESALHQSDCTVEVIVIDDESVDNTCQVLTEFGNQIRWKRLPNGGPARARNRGAALARGRWLAFLDADDLWEPDKLISQLNEADRCHAAVVYTNARNFRSDRQELPVDEIRLRPDQCHAGDVFSELLEDNFVTLSGLMVKREVFDQVGGFAEHIHGTEDWDLLLRLAVTENFAVVQDPVTLYRWGDTSLSRQHEVMLQARRQTINRALNSRKGRRLPAAFQRQVRANLWSTAAWFAEPTDTGRAIHWYLRSLRWCPLQKDVYKSLVRAVLPVVTRRRLKQAAQSAGEGLKAVPEIATSTSTKARGHV